MDEEAALSVEDATFLLCAALRGLATGDVGVVEWFVDDVIGNSVNLSVRSRSDLRYQLLDRAGALSNVEFHLYRVEERSPGTVDASWCLTGDHTGEVLFNEDVLVGPTGQRIRLSVTTRVVFRGRRIAGFRTLHEDGNLLDQIRSARVSPAEPSRDPEPRTVTT